MTDSLLAALAYPTGRVGANTYCMFIKFMYAKCAFLVHLYSRLSLNRHLFKTDTLLKWKSRVGPCLSLLLLVDSL